MSNIAVVLTERHDREYAIGARMPQQKTYWHLLQQRRIPTDYEIVTSKLLCYTGEGFTGKRFELDVPLKDWYRRYQEESLLVCRSWEKFSER